MYTNSTFNVSGNLQVGWAGGNGQFLMTGNSTYNQSSNSFWVGVNGGGAQGLFSMSNGSVANITADMRIGDNEAGRGGEAGGPCSGTLSMSGNSVIHRSGGSYIIFGQGDSTPGGVGATGYLNMSGSSQIIGNGPGSRWITSVGHDGGTGSIVMTNNTRYESAEMMVGQNAGSVGNVHVTDGTIALQSSPDWTVEWWYGWEGSLDIGRWGGTGTVVMDGLSILDVGGRTNIGNGNDYAGGHTSVGSLTLAGLTMMTTHAGTMRNYGWVWNDGGDVYVGCAEWDNGANGRTQTQGGGIGSLTVKDSATLSIPTGQFYVGVHSGTGTCSLTGSGGISAINSFVGLLNGVGDMTMGNGVDNPTVNMSNEFRVGDSGYGTFTMNSGNIACAQFRVGYNGYGNADNYGVMTMNNGSVNVTDWVQVGNNDGGTNGNNVGTFTMNNGTFTKSDGGGYILIGRGLNGTWNQEGGTTYLGHTVCLGNRGYTGALNLDGGTLTAGAIQMGYENDWAAKGVINFNGGVLKVSATAPDGPATATTPGGAFITKYQSTTASLIVKTGGAIIDTNGIDCSIGGDSWGDFPLLHDPILGAAVDGGLTKNGLGKLCLTGNNTFTGPLHVVQGSVGVAVGGHLSTLNITTEPSTTLDLSRDPPTPVLVNALQSLTLKAGSTFDIGVPTSNANPIVDVRGAGGAGGLLTLDNTGTETINLSMVGPSVNAGAYKLFWATPRSALRPA